jgi:Sulfotransferase domain
MPDVSKVTYPNFIILGTQKAGTRWMLNMLIQHADVFMPTYEVHYFDRPDNYARGPEWYASHFADARQETAIGEKTPSYLIMDKKDPLGMPARIHDLVPDAKLIAILRNPVERAISAINHHIRVGYLAADIDLDEVVPRFIEEDRVYIRYGYYHRHLTAYRQFFDPAQMLVLIYEDDVVAQPLHTLQRVCSFIGVDPAFPFAGLEKRYNEGRLSSFGLKLIQRLPRGKHATARLMAGVERALGIRSQKKRPAGRAIERLYEVYAPENAKLFEMLGREVTSWNASEAYVTR